MSGRHGLLLRKNKNLEGTKPKTVFQISRLFRTPALYAAAGIWRLRFFWAGRPLFWVLLLVAGFRARKQASGCSDSLPFRKSHTNRPQPSPPTQGSRSADDSYEKVKGRKKIYNQVLLPHGDGLRADPRGYGSQWWSNICGRTRIGVYLLSNTTTLWIHIYTIYYIGRNYMFWHFPLAIFRLIYEKLSKQLYSNFISCIQRGGKRWSGYDISHVLCRMGGVGTRVLVFLLF